VGSHQDPIVDLGLKTQVDAPIKAGPRPLGFFAVNNVASRMPIEGSVTISLAGTAATTVITSECIAPTTNPLQYMLSRISAGPNPVFCIKTNSPRF
jgi:hypothetical protein